MKFNKKIFNCAAWITLILMYVLPYQSTDGFATEYGYPFPFLTMYNSKTSTSLLKSASIDIFSLIVDIAVVYIVIYLAYKISVKIKKANMIDKN